MGCTIIVTINLKLYFSYLIIIGLIIFYKMINRSEKTVYRGNGNFLSSWLRRLSFPFLIEIINMIRMKMTCHGNVLDGFKKNFTCNRITTFTNMISGNKVTWFIIMSKINPDIGIKSITTMETTNISPNSPIKEVTVRTPNSGIVKYAICP